MATPKPIKTNGSTGDLADFASTDYVSAQNGGTALDGSSAANGSLLIGNGSGYSLNTLTPGTGISISNGSGTITITNSGGSSAYTVQSKSTSFNAAASHFYSITGSSSITVTLPDATACSGQSIIIMVESSSLSILNWATTSSQTINDLSANTIINLGNQGDFLIITSDGANWWITSTSVFNTDTTLSIAHNSGGIRINTVPGNMNLADIGGSLNLASQVGSSILPPANGGTGYDNTSANGHILIGDSTTGYTDGQLTSSVSSLTITQGAGTLNADINLAHSNTFTAAQTFGGIVTYGSGTVQQTRVVTAAGAITVATTDYIIIVNKTSGAATAVNLMATPTTGTIIIVKDGKGDAATNNITINPAAGNIDGVSTFVINLAYGSATLVYNGSQWNVI